MILCSSQKGIQKRKAKFFFTNNIAQPHIETMIRLETITLNHDPNYQNIKVKRAVLFELAAELFGEIY